nr:hypothetical protein [Tanacetum cinerariifolium]
MFEIIPPIPSPFGASSDNPGSPNVNRVETMPKTTDPINTTTTTNVSQSVVDENLPQLLDSRGGSHVTNVSAFDKEDFTTHEGPSDTRDTKIVALRLKFDAFKSLEGEKDSDSDVKEDHRTNNEFMVDLNAEFRKRAPLANQKRKEEKRKCLLDESFDWDDESISSNDEGSTNKREIMAIAEDEPSVGKSNARLDQMLSEQVPGNIVKALGGKGRKKEKISSKEVVFTKANKSSPMLAPEITSDSDFDCDSQEPLPPHPKIIGAAPSGTSENLISLSDLILNMADLTLETYDVKGLIRQIDIPTGNPSSSSQPSSSKDSKQKT